VPGQLSPGAFKSVPVIQRTSGVGVTVGVLVGLLVGVLDAAGVLVAVPLSHGMPLGFVQLQYIPLGIGGCRFPQLLLVTTPLTATQ
jgi:hypothetical protein